MNPRRRVRFFTGQLLSADDLQAEQDYFLEKSRRLNRMIPGAGIVTGLCVSVAGNQIRVAPGVAIDALGREILVEAPEFLPLPGSGGTDCLVLRYVEVFTDPVPAAGVDAGVEYSRIEERFTLEFVPSDEVSDDALILARVVHAASGWRVHRGGCARATPQNQSGGGMLAWALGGLIAGLLWARRR